MLLNTRLNVLIYINKRPNTLGNYLLHKNNYLNHTIKVSTQRILYLQTRGPCVIWQFGQW